MFKLSMILLNEITDNLKHGRFHQHLREIFAPLVVRYVDLMETSITQSIHKGFEKEKWESKGYVINSLLNILFVVLSVG